MVALKKETVPLKLEGQQGKPKKQNNKNKSPRNEIPKKRKNIISEKAGKGKNVKNNVGKPNPLKDIDLILCFGYQYKYLLGKGSEGTVFLAQDLRRGGLVAIKVLDMERRRRLQLTRGRPGLGELCYWSHLNHPNLIQLFEKVAYPNHIFFVMEYTSNDTLVDYIYYYRRPITSQPPTWCEDEQLMIKWSQELLTAIQYLHSLGLYHLDIKPNNIFLDSQWNLKLGDFGFLRAKNELCRSVFLGCPFYMPPETHTVKPFTSKNDLEKVDVWSCGVTIFEMLTGRIISGTNFVFNRKDLKKKALYGNIKVNLQRLKRMDIGYGGAKDFVLVLLKWDPKLRPTATVALTHPWLRLQLDKLILPDSFRF